MADITVRTQTLDRDELQKFIPVGNFRLIKAFENLLEDVSTTIPDAIGTAITGPGTAVDGDLVLFDGADGTKVKESGVNITEVALLDSPAFTGVPTAPTAAPGTSTTQLATTEFVTTGGFVVGTGASVVGHIPIYSTVTGKVITDGGIALTSLAPLASPAFTGVPTAPTAAAGTNTTQIATTAFARTLFAAPPALGSTTPAAVSATTITASSTITPNQTAGIVGTTTNNNANAGSVGEYQTANTLTTAATTGTPLNATSISLTAGDWDVNGLVQFNPAAGTVTQTIIAGISTTSATFVATPFFQAVAITPAATASAGNIIEAPMTRISIAGTTTVYLVAQANFTVSTMTVSGIIRARRIR